MKYKVSIVFLLVIFISNFFINYSLAVDNPSLGAEAAILIEAKSGKILYEKNSEQKMYPASLTKILTAILTIENSNLNDKVVVNYNALSKIPSGYTLADLQPDEEITVENLLDVLLLHSANDAANVLAMHVGGSLDSFVSMMNSKASELGCKNTHFTNAYGLHDENHWSCAKDLAIISQYCMKNNTFRSFVSQPNAIIHATNKHDARSYNNTNDLLIKNSQYYYEGTIGIKTGYTKEAKNCLISACLKNDLEVISVVMGDENTQVSQQNRYSDTIQLLEYAYNNFSIKKIVNKDDIITQIEISQATEDSKNLDLIAVDDIKCFVSNNYVLNNIEPKIKYSKALTAPIAKGAVIGTATYNIDGIEYKTDLIASHDVQKSEFLILTIRAILAIIILIIVALLLLYKKRK